MWFVLVKLARHYCLDGVFGGVCHLIKDSRGALVELCSKFQPFPLTTKRVSTILNHRDLDAESTPLKKVLLFLEWR